ncbi:WD40 repeat domain-containing protein [Phytomonospora endophytica]|uniref:WD40 repeat protein n=1 Tax=Phytomonospora endophytica TaxID=714109 RepID=A0A841FLX2_9ACTN|nr:WD40 repeat domain-containing protein [Phytomonospora endophytica]MBB6036995.1 WD40 repeat protein [Phytomonospora endophytica]
MSDPRLLSQISLPERAYDTVGAFATPAGPLVLGKFHDGPVWAWDPQNSELRVTLLRHEGFDAHLADYLGEEDLATVLAFAWHDGRALMLAGSKHDDPDEHVHDDGAECFDSSDEDLEMPAGGAVRLYDALTGELVRGPFAAHDWDLWSVALLSTPGGLVGLSGGGDGCRLVIAWDLDKGAMMGEPFEGHEDGVSGASLSLVDGRVIGATGSHDSGVRVWDVRATGQLGEPWALPGQVRVTLVTTVAGRAVIAAGGDFDGIHLRDLDTGEALPPIAGPPARALAVLEHDGRSLIAGIGDDDVARIWDPADGSEAAAPIPCHGDMLATTDVDGRALVVVSGGEGVVQAWDPFA